MGGIIKMLSSITSFTVLNTLIIVGMIIAGICVVVIDDLLPCIISMAVVGTFVMIEFLLLRAPDVAIAEGAVGMILTPVIFIIALSKSKENNKEKKRGTDK
jgi:energy-converting hydrogenase B subunit D